MRAIAGTLSRLLWDCIAAARARLGHQRPDSERRGMDGALAELEAARRGAEEVAAIADKLLLPASLETWMHTHRPGT